MIEKDKINVIDWIQLEKDWFRMGKILDDIKTAAGRGITVVVLQKKERNDSLPQTLNNLTIKE